MTPQTPMDATALVTRLSHKLAQAARAASPEGVLLRGAWGSGTSWILRGVVARLRADGLPAVLRVADGRTALDPPVSGPVLVVDDAHRLGEADAFGLRDRLLNGDAPVLLGGRAAAEYPEPIAAAVTSGLLMPATPPVAGPPDLVRLLPVPGRMHRGSAARILRDAGGRLGFAADLVHEGIADGSIRLRNGLWRITGEQDVGAVRERLDLELRLVDAAESTALGLACLLGWVPEEEGLPETDPDAVRALVTRGYLVAGATGGLVPDPPVLTTAARRVGERIPSELARFLIDRYGAHAPAVAAVRWHADAGIDPPSAWCEDAARASWSAGRAQDALDLLAGADQTSTGVLRLRAEILADVGRRDEALAALEQLERVADGETRRAVAAERAAVTMWDIGRRDEALAIAERIDADEQAQPRDQVRHALLLLESGHLAKATDRVRALVDGEAAGAALMVLAVIAAFAGDGRGALDLAERAARADPDPSPGPPVAALTTVLAMTEAGELREAGEVVGASLRAAGSEGPSAQAWLALSAARVHLLRGSPAAARALAWESAEIFSDLDQTAMYQWALAMRLLAETAQHEDDAVRASLAELEAQEEPPVIFIAIDVRRALAWGAAAQGDWATARRRMRDAAEAAAAAGAWGLAGQAWHDLVLLGDALSAAEPLGDLRGRVSAAWAEPRAAHARAVVTGDVEQLLEVSTEFASFDAVRAAAGAASDARRLARDRDNRDAERRANGMLNRWSAERGLSVPAPRGAAVALTPREREVAELAASGRTSREVADELGISQRTVQNLLHRAYYKLDVHDRAGLAAVLAAGL